MCRDTFRSFSVMWQRLQHHFISSKYREYEERMSSSTSKVSDATSNNETTASTSEDISQLLLSNDTVNESSSPSVSVSLTFIYEVFTSYKNAVQAISKKQRPQYESIFNELKLKHRILEIPQPDLNDTLLSSLPLLVSDISRTDPSPSTSTNPGNALKGKKRKISNDIEERLIDELSTLRQNSVPILNVANADFKLIDYANEINSIFDDLKELELNAKSKAFNLGMYLKIAREYCKSRQRNFNSFVEAHLTIKSISQIKKYITFYKVIKDYPILLNSTLSFSNICKNSKVISKVMKT